MDYKEKVEKGEEVSIMILNGISEDKCRKKLIQESFKSYEIDKIVKSAKKIIKSKYSERIRAQMLDGSLGSHLDDYDELSAEIFEEIQYEQLDKIKSTYKSELIKGLKLGHNIEDLQSQLVGDYFSKEQFDEIVQKYENIKSKVTNGKMIGTGAIVIGIILSLTGSDMNNNGGVVFYGLIIYGAWRLFKSFGTMDEIVI